MLKNGQPILRVRLNQLSTIFLYIALLFNSLIIIHDLNNWMVSNIDCTILMGQIKLVIRILNYILA